MPKRAITSAKCASFLKEVSISKWIHCGLPPRLLSHRIPRLPDSVHPWCQREEDERGGEEERERDCGIK